jgi:2-polyprenyl-3-methyl-5-hydroxy-6-metoxy-1,4-benzoquinol methylase
LKLVETQDGYFQIDPMPSAQELRAYYRDQYYAAPTANSQYAHEYTQEELLHKQLPAAEIERLSRRPPGTMFEVGFGEGFVLDYLEARGWRVGGIDFADAAVRKHFPRLVDRLQFGDIFELLQRHAASGTKHDVLVCDHVLEHVLDPESLLRDLRNLVAAEGLLRIQVPNDGSWLQREIVRRQIAKPDFWLRPQEHLSYFTSAPLLKLMRRCGWRVLELLADFPIDLFMLDPDSCYAVDSGRGRNAHFARVAFELGLWRQSIDALIEFRRGCARGGVGRNLIVYARLET